MIKTLKIEDAVGQVLSHDITEIRPGEFKGAAFKKGHRIQPGDICHLQRLGKRHIYIIDPDNECMHEDDAAILLADAFCGEGVCWEGEPNEGKLKLYAAADGILYVQTDSLKRINMLEDIMCATVHTHTVVQKGHQVAATRAIPLFINKDIVDDTVRIAGDTKGILHVKPIQMKTAAILITGDEIADRLVDDCFEPILRAKLDALGVSVVGVAISPDDADQIQNHLRSFIQNGADIILTTGGMSVDPDDVTRMGVQKAGGDKILYGSPVLPGAMFMIARIGDIPVLGVPACGIYHKTTMLDLMLPRILAGEIIDREDLASMGHGGLCLDCPECSYPVCPFGK